MQIKKIIKKSGYIPAPQHQNFGYHLVTKSPWPILMSFSLLNLAIGAVLSMHGFNHGGTVISLGLIITVFGMGLWFRDIVMEGTRWSQLLLRRWRAMYNIYLYFLSVGYYAAMQHLRQHLQSVRRGGVATESVFIVAVL